MFSVHSNSSSVFFLAGLLKALKKLEQSVKPEVSKKSKSGEKVSGVSNSKRKRTNQTWSNGSVDVLNWNSPVALLRGCLLLSPTVWWIRSPCDKVEDHWSPAYEGCACPCPKWFMWILSWLWLTVERLGILCQFLMQLRDWRVHNLKFVKKASSFCMLWVWHLERDIWNAPSVPYYKMVWQAVLACQNVL